MAVAGDLEIKRAALCRRLRDLGSVLVAYSGGVDSALVLSLARAELGDRAVAMTAVSASLAAAELAAARRFALEIGARHLALASGELGDSRYAANPPNRCYFCKTELYRLARAAAAREGLAAVVDGFNADDARDHRPGRQAALEAQVVSPLAEVALSKREVRGLAEALGLSVWDKPQSPCLASRLPYGTAVSTERLAAIEAAEASLRALGFREFRVRHHGEVARLEVAAGELSRFEAPHLRAEAIARIKEAGFAFVAIDLEPFRSGRLNDLLPSAARVALTLAG